MSLQKFVPMITFVRISPLLQITPVWRFKDQIEHCIDDEEVEETIESLHRIDTL
jgi:hypothetical protein